MLSIENASDESCLKTEAEDCSDLEVDPLNWEQQQNNLVQTYNMDHDQDVKVVWEKGDGIPKRKRPSYEEAEESPFDAAAWKIRVATIKAKLLRGEFKLIDVERKKSLMWSTLAKILDENSVEVTDAVSCKTCFKILRFVRGSSSNLSRHKCVLRARGIRCPEIDVDIETKKKCTRIMTEWTMKNGHVFSIIDDAGLKNLAHFFISVGANYGENVNVDTLLPHPDIISRNIRNLYESHFHEIQEEILAQKKFGYGITSDILTHDNTLYLSLTIQYIKEGTIINRLLAIKSIDSGDCIYNTIEKTLGEFKCDLKKDSPIIVTSRKIKINTTERGLNTIYCVKHLINKVIAKVLIEVPDLLDLVESCSKLVRYLKKSANNSYLETTLKSYCPNRWNTIFYLFKSIELNWDQILTVLERSNQVYRTQDIALSHLKGITELLAPFEECEKKLEGNNYPTLHLTIPYMNNLKKKTMANINEIEIVKNTKLAITESLEVEIQNNLSAFHRIALFLFPPTNKLSQFSKDQKDQTIKECKEMMEESSCKNPTEMTDTIPSPNTQTDSIFADYMQPSEDYNIHHKIEIEMQAYLNMNISYSEEFNVLQWWSGNKEQFPHLYNVSCKILAIPASTAASEKAFLVAENLLNEERCKTPDLANKITFLKTNITNYNEHILADIRNL